jgi:hypothetical protein
MTVQELIDKLEDCNPDFTVVDFELDEIKFVEEDDNAEEVQLS